MIGLIAYFIIVRPQQKYYEAHHVNINGIYLLKPITINNFELIDNHNHSFTKDNLKNHWTLLFFGFTHCSLICPVTLSALNQMYELLQKTIPNQYLPQVVFISVDPERDTIERLNQYITSFNTHFIGASTTMEKTVALEKELHITATVVQSNDSNGTQYTINHSTAILLINPSAKIQAYFSYPPEPKQMAKDYYAIIVNDIRNSTKIKKDESEL